MRKASFWLSLGTCLAALLCVSPVSLQAQNREKFVISAKAGGINAVTGRASMHGRGTTEWQQLTIKEDLEAGDVVKTGLDGRVEMLLNPGSYLRVGENSEFELTNNSLDNLEVRLLRGIAVVEATGAEDTELLINIITPDTRMAIVRRGLYRVNVVPGNSTELIVRKGRVMLGDDSHTKVKGGNKVVFTSGSFSVAKLRKEDKADPDNLEAWSKQRAETVAQANRQIRGRDLNLLTASFNDPWFDTFSRGRTQGYWVYHTSIGCYTFVPFYFGWGSPYGSSYTSSFYGGGCYACGGDRYGSPNVIGGGSGAAAGSATAGGNSAGNAGNTMPPTPSPAAVSAPREIPAAAERKIDRLNDRMPNP